MPVTPADIPYRKRRANNLQRTSVHELARVLYVAHCRGWQSLSLAPTSGSRPQAAPTPATSGYVRYACTMPVGEALAYVDVMLTSCEYAAAFEALTAAQQSEVSSYYRRSPSKGDVCPTLDHGHYYATFEAFVALQKILIERGLLKVNQKLG